MRESNWLYFKNCPEKEDAMKLFRQEFRMNCRTMLAWALCVGGACLGCLALYGSLEESMKDMSDMFAGLGAFSEALGMDKVGIGTLEGYYAVEISILFSLGGALFAAMLGAGLVAKEEEGHTAEFLNVLPLGRGRIIGEKAASLTVLLAGFHLICIGLILAGFAWMGETPDMKCFACYHGLAFLMCLEIAVVCFLFSAACRKRPVGAAVGLTVFFYMMDLMCRVVPDLEKIKYITPFYYANAADRFAGEEFPAISVGIGAAVLLLALGLSLWVYRRKDLA